MNNLKNIGKKQKNKKVTMGAIIVIAVLLIWIF